MTTKLRFWTSSFSLLLMANIFMIGTVTSSFVDDKDEYDFIVVGAGSAGAVVASRLSETSSISVLLLEAGTDLHPVEYFLSEIPSAAESLVGTAFDWQYVMMPQTDACLGLPEQQCPGTRGKALGGSSRINVMAYVRGNYKDYNRWSDLGNSGWSYKEVLPYFLKSEDNTNYDLTKSRYHSTGGLLTVSDANYRSTLVTPILQSIVESGYKIQDINGKSQLGFSIVQGTVRNGRRMDTAKAFLRPFSSRPNLHIVQGAYVQKILFDEQKAAYGVEYLKDGTKKTAKCSKEVILSAGVINSPQLLMLSGVGPEDQLQQFNIKQVAILPGVGENFMEHIGTMIPISSDDTNGSTSATFAEVFNKFVLFIEFIQWLFFGTGILSTFGGVEVTGFVNTPKQLADDPDWPDIQFGYFFSPLSASPQTTFNIATTILHPKSRGTVRLSSSDPNVYPEIDPKYFSHPDDMKALISGMKAGLDIATNSSALKQRGLKAIPETRPGCSTYEFLSDEYLECLARLFTFFGYHYAGTCKMGPESDEQSVVDEQLRVRKVQRLRVVDASIMPYVISGNTNAPCIMIGEKGSDLIKMTYGLL